MPPRCFVCRLKRKGCVQPSDRQSCDACQRTHVECMPCTIKVPNVLRKSARAQECLEETRDFLSYLESNLWDTTGHPIPDARILPTSTIISPLAILPTAAHGWLNQVGDVSAHEVSSTVVPSTNELGNVPVTNEVHPAVLYLSSTPGLSTHVGSADEALLYPSHVPNYVASTSATKRWYPAARIGILRCQTCRTVRFAMNLLDHLPCPVYNRMPLRMGLAMRPWKMIRVGMRIP
ncbi:uncharacterized protein EI90DRAFT_2500477 [Cantharellus anzutake]|uniref:uncharacterized protein n=1 Tax=Cantharellus anzutake TaxID=1750568 RepID=UPI001905CAAB|nr:uncharacterized protein EI90DRAFT_2500477 [Cantharellus anzutake]KAF8321856.1 hypothetical protein EI90DRAFT_2500477 [Cantharellus anzutake]